MTRSRRNGKPKKKRGPAPLTYAIQVGRSPEPFYGSLFRNTWREIVSFFVFFVGDAVRILAIIMVLYAVKVLISFGSLAGVNPDDLELLERLDFWLNYAAFFITGVWFLIRLVRWMWREYRDS